MRVGTLALAAMILARLAWAVGSDHGLGWDFPNYYNAGGRAAHGELATLYDSTGTIDGHAALGDGRQIYYGAPISAFVFAPLGWFEPRPALVVFKVFCAACFAAGLVQLLGLLRPSLDRQFRASLILPSYLLAVLLAAPIWFTFEVGGQATAINFLLLVLFVRDYHAGREAPAALWLTLGVLIKPALAPLGLVLLLGREWRVIGWGALASAALAILSLAVAGLPLHQVWLALIRRDSAMLTVPWWNNASVPGALYTFWYGWQTGSLAGTTVPDPLFYRWLGCYKLGLLMFMAWLGWDAARARIPLPTRRLLLAGLGIMLCLLLSNIIWPHYLAFLAIPLGLMAGWYDRLSGTGRVALSLVALGTLSVQSRSMQWALLHRLDGHPLPLALTAACFSGVTLLLLLFLLGVAWRPMVRRLVT